MFNTVAVFTDVYMRQDRKRGICVSHELNRFPERRLQNMLFRTLYTLIPLLFTIQFTMSRKTIVQCTTVLFSAVL